MSHQEQAKYKYIIYIEGNVSAYRGAFLFSMGSVVIWIKSNFKLWFEKKLKHRENCILIEPDFQRILQ